MRLHLLKHVGCICSNPILFYFQCLKQSSTHFKSAVLVNLAPVQKLPWRARTEIAEIFWSDFFLNGAKHPQIPNSCTFLYTLNILQTESPFKPPNSNVHFYWPNLWLFLRTGGWRVSCAGRRVQCVVGWGGELSVVQGHRLMNERGPRGVECSSSSE